MGASLSSPRPYQDASRVSNLHPIVRAEQFIALPIRMMDKTLVSQSFDCLGNRSICDSLGELTIMLRHILCVAQGHSVPVDPQSPHLMGPFESQRRKWRFPTPGTIRAAASTIGESLPSAGHTGTRASGTALGITGVCRKSCAAHSVQHHKAHDPWSMDHGACTMSHDSRPKAHGPWTNCPWTMVHMDHGQ